MRNYLRMSDVFKDEPARAIKSGKGKTFCCHSPRADYAAHAVNSHDELVELNRELLAALEMCYEHEWGYGSGITHDEMMALIAKAKGGKA